METGMKLLCIGRTGAGKTVLMFEIIYYLVKNKLIDVSRIVIYSKTVKSDPT
jgi:superfamily II DNA or RNA helicase